MNNQLIPKKSDDQPIQRDSMGQRKSVNMSAFNKIKFSGMPKQDKESLNQSMFDNGSLFFCANPSEFEDQNQKHS